jgi:hypothetical protein
VVYLDHNLIFEARRLINGANIHKLKQLIFVYETAVSLHNDGNPGFRIYDPKYERELRKFVFDRWLELHPTAA